MPRVMKKVLLSLLLIVFLPGCQGRLSDISPWQQEVVPRALTKKRIVEIARQAAGNQVPAHARARVHREGDYYVVTFVRRLPLGARGSDYYAVVRIDAQTRTVVPPIMIGV